MSEYTRTIVMTLIGSVSGALIFNLSFGLILALLDKWHIDYAFKFKYFTFAVVSSTLITAAIGLPLIFIVNQALKGIS